MDGPVRVYAGIFGAVEPANAEATPGVGWTDVGGTMGGATLTLGQEYRSRSVDQVGMAIGASMTNQVLSVATQLAEVTLANLRRVLNQATSSATKLEFGGEDIVNQAPGYQAIMLQGRKPGGGPRLWILRKTLSTEGIGIPFQKDGDTVFPVTWTGYYVSESIRSLVIDDTPAT